MSGWVKIEKEEVSMEHHSTSSLVEITLQAYGERKSIYLNSDEFNDLREAFRDLEELDPV